MSENIIDRIEANREAIIKEFRKADAAAYRNTGCEYRVYIDSEGETGSEVWPAGDNGYYRFSGDYSRTYIGTICREYYDLLDDYWYEGSDLRAADRTEAENEAAMQEALEEVLWSYEAEQEYQAMVDEAIEGFKELEREDF